MTVVTESAENADPRSFDVPEPAGPTSCSGAEASEVLFSFRGRAGGVAVDASRRHVLVSGPSSSQIWDIGREGTARPLSISADPRDDRWTRSPGRFTPSGLSFAPDGSLFVADTNRHRVWTISPEGTIRWVAGGAAGHRDGPASVALFRFPRDVGVGPDGTCYVADTGNHCIRSISPQGAVTTVAGSIYDFGDGRGPEARFRHPAALDVDTDGVCYVADTGNNSVRRIATDGEVTTVAGAPPGGDGEGRGRDLGLRWPTGIAVGTDRSVWVADHGNGAIRHITSSGESSTHLRLTVPDWPTAIASHGPEAVVVAGDTLVEVTARSACVLFLGSTS